jgi:hypothetical protein
MMHNLRRNNNKDAVREVRIPGIEVGQISFLQRVDKGVAEVQPCVPDSCPIITGDAFT